MKIIKKMRKAKGFTLVELLIVIIIIGILAGMMMLATGAATDKAEATKIVSNMRNIKAAAIMYYADKNVWPLSTSSDADLNDKLDQPLLGGAGKGYSITENPTDTFNVTVNGAQTVPSWTSTSGIADKLKDMATTSSIMVSGDIATMKIN